MTFRFNLIITALAITTAAIHAETTATIYGSLKTPTPEHEVFLTFSEEIPSLGTDHFKVTNGKVASTSGKGRYWSAAITAASPGDVSITLSGDLKSNTWTTACTSDFGDRWIVDDQASWVASKNNAEGLELVDGFATPNTTKATFTSTTKSYPTKKKARTLTLTQSPVWDNWIEVPNIGPKEARDAPVLLPVGKGNYYLLALFKQSEGYHAWHSTDMKTWTHKGPVAAPKTGRWTTSAEYKDGTFYIYSDHYNDHTPHLFTDTDLGDGKVGKYHGAVFEKEASGSDCSLFRDNADGLFHLIYEDWSPLNARKHSWDSPLAGHTTSEDGLTGFTAHEHQPPIDFRTKPTGKIQTYDHPNKKNVPYEVHTPEQDAFGDWTTIKVGSRYYMFADYDPAGKHIRVARFTSDSIYKEFKLVGELGKGHPDPTVGFAEGQFYLITQQKTDYISPGPWVDGVEARAGVDVDNDGKIDQWTDWEKVSEQYDYTPNFIRCVTTTPAQIDLTNLPAGHGFKFEFRVDDTVVKNVSPIMDRVEMKFEPGDK